MSHCCKHSAGDIRIEDDVYMVTVDKATQLHLVVAVENTGEDAHQALLYVSLPPGFDYLYVTSEVLQSRFILYCSRESP